MQFYKFLILSLIIVSSVAFSEQKQLMDSNNEKTLNTEALDKGIKNTEQFETQETRDWIKTVKKPPSKTLQQDARAVINSTSEEMITKAVKDDDENSENVVFAEIEKASETLIPKIKQQEPSTRYGDIDGYILVSLSMPKVSLQRLFLESVYQYPDKNLVFLFQGWNAPHLKEFMYELYQNFESVEKAPSVAIDPTVFNKLEVTEVPYFALKNNDGQWKSILGDVTITQAFDESENQYSNATPVGRTYPIKEQNMLAYIEQKIKNYDFDKDIKTTTGNVMQDKFEADLIVSRENRSYYVDPTTVIKKAIMHRDQVIVAPGTKINPLEYMPLTRDYVFIDATDKAQVEIAKKWKIKNKQMTLITTKMPKAESTLKIIIDNFDKIYEVDPLLKRRFGITHIPSKVSQKGMVLEVTVAKVDQTEKYEDEK